MDWTTKFQSLSADATASFGADPYDALGNLVVGSMQEVGGWPVRNADGGVNIAHFHTVEGAESAITKARRVYKKEFGVDWFALPGGELPPGTRAG